MVSFHPERGGPQAWLWLSRTSPRRLLRVPESGLFSASFDGALNTQEGRVLGQAGPSLASAVVSSVPIGRVQSPGLCVMSLNQSASICLCREGSGISAGLAIVSAVTRFPPAFLLLPEHWLLRITVHTLRLFQSLAPSSSLFPCCFLKSLLLFKLPFFFCILFL